MSVCFLQAQRVRVSAPKQVTVGEEFQVEYIVYTQDVRRFQLGRLSSGLEKVFGPATSSQSNYQFIDGHASSSSSVSFTYVFIATKKGNVNIGPAHIFVNDQELASTPVKIIATTGSHSTTSGGYMIHVQTLVLQLQRLLLTICLLRSVLIRLLSMNRSQFYLHTKFIQQRTYASLLVRCLI